MTHVHLTSAERGTYKLVVDGVDISRSISAELTVTLGGEPYSPALVSVQFIANDLDVDLPDALLQAITIGADDTAGDQAEAVAP